MAAMKTLALAASVHYATIKDLFVSYWTGMSAGFSPLRIRPV